MGGEQRVLVTLAEVLYIVRPLVHCVALRQFGLRSWRPYLLSLLVDFLRMMLEINFPFTQRTQREEFEYRNNTALLNYILRNPFYAVVLKRKIIDPFLNRLFGDKSWIKWFLVSLIEMRCCVSTLM